MSVFKTLKLAMYGVLMVVGLSYQVDYQLLTIIVLFWILSEIIFKED
jgi:hypothetical protein